MGGAIYWRSLVLQADPVDMAVPLEVGGAIYWLCLVLHADLVDIAVPLEEAVDADGAGDDD